MSSQASPRPSGQPSSQLSQEAVRLLAKAWYEALDRHDELADVTRFLVDDGLEMRFPEATARGHAGFAGWYEAVTHRFFDETHTITEVEVTPGATEATVTVLVNWQASVWNPPKPRSEWLGFDADQTWIVVPGENGPLIKTYIVNGLAPMPGSASL
ncbi:hypothetical protein GCM10010156_59690 [Planobispora rosea]|uniref:SnoaL-like domain-containing protein n=1 Tax=Planobispora rosea TaxID=35762 RepID=A0A8J3WGX4_PLARO|nr:nuclear transport factor 2 family protein [Planobispora rosea]GGS93481.1 hypothetical protein GCM10010156_59690 [Planobispora rosea]GIH87271.1 hypothetical protein Pro02_56790 [Planobispora rosea]